VTANGNIIMATNDGNRIAEYDFDGKLLLSPHRGWKVHPS
jgi:hypothetical protein